MDNKILICQHIDVTGTMLSVKTFEIQNKQNIGEKLGYSLIEKKEDVDNQQRMLYVHKKKANVR